MAKTYPKTRAWIAGASVTGVILGVSYFALDAQGGEAASQPPAVADPVEQSGSTSVPTSSASTSQDASAQPTIAPSTPAPAPTVRARTSRAS
jgi:hypothetical protein